MAEHLIDTVQNDQAVTREQAERDAAPAPVREAVPLPEVLRQIRRDSGREPQQYLDETIVPFGGE